MFKATGHGDEIKKEIKNSMTQRGNIVISIFIVVGAILALGAGVGIRYAMERQDELSEQFPKQIQQQAQTDLLEKESQKPVEIPLAPETKTEPPKIITSPLPATSLPPLPPPAPKEKVPEKQNIPEITPQPISQPSLPPPIPEPPKPKSVLIFVDELTYQQLANEINRLMNDIKNDLSADVSVEHGNYTNPIQIRNIIKNFYDNKGLLGSILIGDIPTFYRNDGFYTDWFYQELSNRCSITSSGEFENDPNNCNVLDATADREVFSGRITPPVSGQEGITLIKKYLDKNHAYRIGEIKFDKKMLVYPAVSINNINDGYSVMKNTLGVNLDFALSRLKIYSRSQVDLIETKDYGSARQDYLQKLKNNSYETALINIHGTDLYQAIGKDSQVTYTDIKDVAPNIFYASLLSCSNGGFKTQNYFAGWLLFSGNTLVVNAQSAVAAISDLIQDPPSEPVFFIPLNGLGLGSITGEMTRRDDSLFITQTFGDPTLRMRQLISSGPKVVASEKLDFGKVIGGKSKSLAYIIRNDGDRTLELRRLPTRGFTIDGNFPFNWDKPASLIEVAPSMNFMGFDILALIPYRTITIEPGKQKEIMIGFAPAVFRTTKLTKTGGYFDIARFITNDPAKPYLDIRLVGEGI